MTADVRRFKATEITLRKHGNSISDNKWFQGDNKGNKIPAIYARQSTEQQCTLDEQIVDCVENAIKNGNKKALLFTDKGSAWKKNSEEKLYGMQHLMRCVARGYIGSIIVYDISRLSRNMAMGIKLMNGIKDYDLQVHSLMNEVIYNSSPQSCDAFLEKILDAQKSSTISSERIKTKFKHMKARGHRFGKPRYGLRAVKIDGIRKFITNAEENKVVKQIKAKFTRRGHWDQRRNLRNIVQWLEDNGHTKRGYSWNTTKVWDVINNPFDMSELQDSLTS